ncbi:hypothetical protein [Idiomarina sp.]|uniref:hypothetical protein n=1 Tax=Idiomarina sp. TaxID=1874361 RepID=UPI0035192D08
MFNSSLSLKFLKTGSELETLIHNSLDDTIKAIFSHHGRTKTISPSEIGTRTNTEYSFFKYFYNHKNSQLNFDEEWCIKLFSISDEGYDKYEFLGALAGLTCNNEDNLKITKTTYKRIKPAIRLFFYMMWSNRAVLLPFYYSPPKFRSSDNKRWVDIATSEMPETLRLIHNTFASETSSESLKEHYKSSWTSLKNSGYRCVIATTWYFIEDISINEVAQFKAFYTDLRSQNPNYSGIVNTLPFNDLLKAFLSFSPERCGFNAKDLETLSIKRESMNSLGAGKTNEHQFKVNVTEKVRILLKNDALEAAVAEAFNSTKIVLLSKLYKRDLSYEYSSIKDYPQAQLCFLRIFPRGVRATLDEIAYLYELLSHEYFLKSDLEPFNIGESKLNSWTSSDSDHFKYGIRVFFLELYNANAVLLPLNFDISSRSKNDYCERRYSELLEVFMNINRISKNDLAGIDSPYTLYRIILACNWRKVEDVTYESALQFQTLYQARRISANNKAKLSLKDILKILLIVAPERCKFKTSELNEVISDTDTSSLIKITSNSNSTNEIAFKWKILINKYLEERRSRGYTSESNQVSALGKLFQFISVDLPRDFGHSSEIIPNTPNQFRRYHLVGNELITYSLRDKIRKTLNNEGFNANLRIISTFFDWIIDTLYDDPDVTEFKNPISELDYLNAPRRGNTNKVAFLGTQFSYVHSFFSSVCEFYWYLIVNNKFVEGASSRKLLYDTQKLGYVPLVAIEGNFYPLYFVPANLTNELLMGREGMLKTYPQFQSIFENLIALETGLRHAHIRWLDRDRFDVDSENHPNKYIGELLVNYARTNQSDSLEVGTDKVKSSPWKPYVSSRVFNLLRRLKAFQDSLGVDVPPLWYQGHEGSIHGKILSIFNTLDATSAVPSVISEGTVSKQYRRMLFFFDLFIQLSGVNEVKLLGKTPQQSLDAIEKAKALLLNELDEKASESSKVLEVSVANSEAMTESHHYQYNLWKSSLKNAFYFNGKYDTPFTPHGTRSSVASARIKVLPPEAIKEFITGHESTAVLSYYIQVDPEFLKETNDFNQLVLLSDNYSNGELNKRNAGNELLSLQSKMKEVIEQDPSLLVRDFGAMSFSTEDTGDKVKGGLSILNITPVSNYAFMATHICPFGGNCPDDIKQEVGERQCGQCYYSIKTVDNIPRILAHMRKLFYEMEEMRESIEAARDAGAEISALKVREGEVETVSRELAAWVYTHEILESNLKTLRERNVREPQSFFVAKPDMLMEHFAEGKVDNDDISRLLVRINDAKSFKEYFTPQLKAQINKIRKKILIKEKDFSRLINEPAGYDLLDEFRGILRAYVDARGISLKEASRQLSEPLEVNHTLNLLERLNG